MKFKTLKFQNYFRISATALTASLLIITSCSKDDATITESVSVEQVSPTEYGLPKDVLEKTYALNMTPGDVEFEIFTYPDGVTSELVILAGDIAIKKEDFLKLSESDTTSKQYKAETIVDISRFPTIDIYAFTGNTTEGLSALAQQGVRDAVLNWNSTGSRLRFTVTFGTERNFDRSIYEVFIGVSTTPNRGFGGRAEFPSGGNPGSSLTITPGANTSTNRNAANAMKLVMTHELGHAIGFRHTDWDTRRSCVREGVANEDSREPDAIHIAGTSTSDVIQNDSLMNGCFGVDSTTGNFNEMDVAAVLELYPLLIDPR